MLSQSEDIPEEAEYLIFTEFKHFDEVMGYIKSSSCVNSTFEEEHIEDGLQVIFNFYQEQPHLLDPFLEQMINACLDVIRTCRSNSRTYHLTFRILHLMIKTRGYKSFIRRMPHTVEEIEPTLTMLTEQNIDDPKILQTRYVLILWLSILVMVPFGLSTLDAEGKTPIVDRIMTECKRYVCRDARTHQAAAFLLARLVTRPDVIGIHLKPLLSWCMDKIRDADYDSNDSLNQVCGVMRCIANICKIGQRQEILPHALDLFSAVRNIPEGAFKSIDICRLSSKVLQRIGLLFCSPRSTSWQYQRGYRSLADNLATRLIKDAPLENYQNVTPSCCALDHDGVLSSGAYFKSPDDDLTPENADAVAEIIDQLIGYLRSPFTVVRWSSAKGLGRISSRLPSALADDVLSAILALCTRLEPFNAWHGACLALAELGRRSLLLPTKLPEVIPIVLRALYYDERSGDYNYGSNVRDAACYVCWAFARAYKMEDFAPYVRQVAAALVLVSLFDREVNVRRASAAAFQENVGRQGQFPHGIEILTTCDYFAVRNRTTCFLQLSTFVAQFDEYVRPMIDHLCFKLLSHWDANIRILAARALNALVPFDTEYMLNTVFPQLVRGSTEGSLFSRQGNMFGTGELIYSFKNRPMCDELLDEVKSIIPKLLESNQFRGLGGDILRRSACHLIQKVASACLPVYGDPVIETWRTFLDSCIDHKDTEVQRAAVAAYSPLLTTYLYTRVGALRCDYRDQVLQFLMDEIRKSSLGSTALSETKLSGYLLVLCAAPKDMFTDHVHYLFDAVISSCKITPRTQTWSGARANALKALACIHEVLGPGHPEVDNALLKGHSAVFLHAFSDYTVDRRGDIGSLVREAGMQCLQRFISFLVKANRWEVLDAPFVQDVMVNIAQQAVEKIDRTRDVAGQCFVALLYHKPPIPHIPHAEVLQRIFPEEDLNGTVWRAAEMTFPKFVQLLDLPEFRFRLLLGLTASVGGMTENTAICSADALSGHLLKHESNEEYVADILYTVERIYNGFLDEPRVIVSLFKLLDFLLTNPVISASIDPTSPVLSSLLEGTWSRTRLATNIVRIKAAIDVFGGMLQFDGPIRKQAINLLVVLLDHRFPVIRKSAATKLYESLIVYFDITEPTVTDQLTVLLTETIWESEFDVTRPIRKQICELLDLPVPKKTPLTAFVTVNGDV